MGLDSVEPIKAVHQRVPIAIPDVDPGELRTARPGRRPICQRVAPVLLSDPPHPETD